VIDVGNIGLGKPSPLEPSDAQKKALGRLAQEDADGWHLLAAFYDRDVAWGSDSDQRFFLFKRRKK
jgi:hypothetical protein